MRQEGRRTRRRGRRRRVHRRRRRRGRSRQGLQDGPQRLRGGARGLHDAGAEVKAEVNRAGTEIRYQLRYRNLEGERDRSRTSTSARRASTAASSLFLCSNLGNGPAGTPACPPSPGEVDGTLDRRRRGRPQTAQGIEGPGAFDEIVRAMRAGVTYANVHSTKFPGGEVRGQFDREHDRD